MVYENLYPVDHILCVFDLINKGNQNKLTFKISLHNLDHSILYVIIFIVLYISYKLSRAGA